MEAEGNLRRQLIEAMGDGLLAFDRDGRLLAANAAAARLLSFSTAKEITMEALERTSPLLLEHIRDALASGEAPPVRELALGGPDPVPVSLTLCGLRDEDGCFGGLVVNLADLTEIRTMEREIQRLDRLAAIGRFAAGVAHEIRNPLAGIGAGVEYLASRLGPDPSDRDDLRIIRAEIARLDRIVAELLDYTRPPPAGAFCGAGRGTGRAGAPGAGPAPGAQAGHARARRARPTSRSGPTRIGWSRSC